MAEENENFLIEICEKFVPQRWRKTKCQTCFKDVIEHTKNLSTENSEILIKECFNLDGNEHDIDCSLQETKIEISKEKYDYSENHEYLEEQIQEHPRRILTSTSTIVADGEHVVYACKKQHNKGLFKLLFVIQSRLSIIQTSITRKPLYFELVFQSLQ